MAQPMLIYARDSCKYFSWYKDCLFCLVPAVLLSEMLTEARTDEVFLQAERKSRTKIPKGEKASSSFPHKFRFTLGILRALCMKYNKRQNYGI